MKITTVVGARPQFIKSAMVSKALRAHDGEAERLVHTGQHYDDNMSGVFFDELDIPAPDHHLGIGSGNHGVQTGRMLEAIERILLDAPPDWVLVYGDTNSTLAGALAAAKLHIPVAHVEAGLRSFNRRMPEEINRVVADQLSALLLAPTEVAVRHLLHEGVPEARIELVGDVMYDAALYYGKRAARTSSILTALDLPAKGYVLATIHRAENTDDPARLEAIFSGLARVARELPVVLPLHPRTRKMLEEVDLLALAATQLRLVDPVGYLDMLMLEQNARVIVTDSGGVQKEAFFYQVPCVTARDETEWVETVEAGANRLVGADANQLVEAVAAQLDRETRLPDPAPLYGSGQAAARIAGLLTEDHKTR